MKPYFLVNTCLYNIRKLWVYLFCCQSIFLSPYYFVFLQAGVFSSLVLICTKIYGVLSILKDGTWWAADKCFSFTSTPVTLLISFTINITCSLFVFGIMKISMLFFLQYSIFLFLICRLLKLFPRLKFDCHSSSFTSFISINIFGISFIFLLDQCMEFERNSTVRLNFSKCFEQALNSEQISPLKEFIITTKNSFDKGASDADDLLLSKDKTDYFCFCLFPNCRKSIFFSSSSFDTV